MSRARPGFLGSELLRRRDPARAGSGSRFATQLPCCSSSRASPRRRRSTPPTARTARTLGRSSSTAPGTSPRPRTAVWRPARSISSTDVVFDGRKGAVAEVDELHPPAARPSSARVGAESGIWPPWLAAQIPAALTLVRTSLSSLILGSPAAVPSHELGGVRPATRSPRDLAPPRPRAVGVAAALLERVAYRVALLSTSRAAVRADVSRTILPADRAHVRVGVAALRQQPRRPLDVCDARTVPVGSVDILAIVTRAAGARRTVFAMNRLAAETSPYLLQHADNPSTGTRGATRRSRARARGQADPPLGRLQRLPLVPRDGARVVRERGDRGADERALRQRQGRPRGAARRRRALHGRAVTMTGQGGWPMTVFLTPAGEPFYAGTYFPPEPRHGLPSLPAAPARGRRGLARRSATTSRRRRGGSSTRSATRRASSRRPSRSRRRCSTRPSAASPARSSRRSAASAGRRSSRPRRRSSSSCAAARREALAMVTTTLDGMAAGGMYDLVGGGFHRYSVDDALARAALREDALRQRAARRGLPPRLGRDGRGALPRGRRGDGRLPAARAAAARAAASRRRRTRTRTASRG